MSDFELVSSEDEQTAMITVGRSAEVPTYGNLLPFMKDRLLWSPQASHWIVILLALCGSTVAFVVFWGSLRFTDPNLLPSRWMTQLPDVVVLLLALLSAAFLLLTSLTNPGILPKNNTPPTLASPAAKEYCTTLPYCMTCHIYRPSQAGHCRRCNNCVAQYDHHCRFFGCCIGELNRRYLLLFLVSITTYTTVISTCLVYFLVVVPASASLVRFIIFAIGLAISALLGLILAGFLFHNLRLLRMGLLHREYMKGVPARSRGRASFFINLMQVLFPKKECN